MSRLEEVKEKAIIEKAHFKNIETGESGWTKIVTLSEENYRYLVRQAERVEDLEELKVHYGKQIQELTRHNDINTDRVKRYKQALEEIKFKSLDYEPINMEAYYISVKALKEGESE